MATNDIPSPAPDRGSADEPIAAARKPAAQKPAAPKKPAPKKPAPKNPAPKKPAAAKKPAAQSASPAPVETAPAARPDPYAVPPAPPVAPPVPPPAAPYAAAPYASAPSAAVPYTAVPAGPSSILSILALIGGILGVLLSFFGFGLVPALAGVILGHLALKREPHARGMAVAGLVTGYIGLAISILWGIFWIAVFLLPFLFVGAAGISGF